MGWGKGDVPLEPEKLVLGEDMEGSTLSFTEREMKRAKGTNQTRRKKMAYGWMGVVAGIECVWVSGWCRRRSRVFSLATSPTETPPHPPHPANPEVIAAGACTYHGLKDVADGGRVCLHVLEPDEVVGKQGAQGEEELEAEHLHVGEVHQQPPVHGMAGHAARQHRHGEGLDEQEAV